MTEEPIKSPHPITQMNPIEQLEMEAEWLKLVDTKYLYKVLGPLGIELSAKMFIEAYSRGYVKARDASKESAPA